MSSTSTLSNFIRKYLATPFTWFVGLIGKISWTQRHALSTAEVDQIKALLMKDNLIICTFSSNRLSSWFVLLGNIITTGKMGKYAHCLINAEGFVPSSTDFQLIEATPTRGVSIDSFDTVFSTVSRCAILKPKALTLTDWAAVIAKALADQGKTYDTLFDFAQDQKLSCIELIRDALMADEHYLQHFGNFEAMLQQYGELTPNMIYTCPDFELVLEVGK